MTDPKPLKEGVAKGDKKQTLFQGLVFVGGVLAYFLLGLGLWWVLDQYIMPQDSGEKKDLIQALGLIMAGLAGIVGVYFTWRNLTMTQRNMEDTQKNTQDQLNAAEAQLRLAQEGQVTERFTKAIDQLGEAEDEHAPRIEIRIGGIYALERIAKHYQEHSPEDYGPILELLTAYIRENAKWNRAEAMGPTLKAHQVDSFDTIWFASGVRGDIQAALDVLGRRQEKRVPEEFQQTLNLRRSNLSGANLGGADLSRADLSQANLSQAVLVKANLSSADLSQSDLSRAALSRAALSGADLSGAILEDAYFEGALLTGMVLTGHDLEQLRSALGLGRQEVGNRMTIESTDLSTVEGLDLKEQLEWAIGDSGTKEPYGSARPEAGLTHHYYLMMSSRKISASKSSASNNV
jgi:hypothetical protein